MSGCTFYEDLKFVGPKLHLAIAGAEEPTEFSKIVDLHIVHLRERIDT